MENYLVNRKQVELSKGKLYTLKIPVTINSQTAKFVIEQININAPVVFYVKSCNGTELTKEVRIDSSFFEFNFFVEDKGLRGNYLFFGLKSTVDVSFALSIKEEVGVPI